MTRLNGHGEGILAFIERYQEAHHRSPSYKEIAEGVGLTSKDHVSRDLRKLEQQGYISFTPGMSRSVVLCKNGSGRSLRQRSMITLPVTRTVLEDKPGRLAEADHEPLDWTAVARELVEGDQDVRVLRVRGGSMPDALVDEGDVVIIRPSHTAEDGEMVAAWLKPQQMMTLKYYHRENGHVRLQPADPALPPMKFKASDIEIRGQVLAIVRKARTSRS